MKKVYFAGVYKHYNFGKTGVCCPKPLLNKLVIIIIAAYLIKKTKLYLVVNVF